MNQLTGRTVITCCEVTNLLPSETVLFNSGIPDIFANLTPSPKSDKQNKGFLKA